MTSPAIIVVAAVVAVSRVCAQLNTGAHSARVPVYTRDSYNVEVTYDVTYAQGTKCVSARAAAAASAGHALGKSCVAKDLLLDVYTPSERSGGPLVQALKPAYILEHGGGNTHGSRGTGPFVGSAKYFASRGFVVFNIDYRLEGDHGLYPQERSYAEGWTPHWASSYPAVRDTKAAVRFVRANAAKYGVDPERIAISGGSAGATNSLAVGVTFEEDYKTELERVDPTLNTTHMEQKSSVACVVSHWATDQEIAFAEKHNPQRVSRYTSKNAPIVEFHGSRDATIHISHAYAVQAAYNKTGVEYRLHVLKGCAHGPWCYGCKDPSGKAECECSDRFKGYCDVMDTTALPFIVQHLNLDLVSSHWMKEIYS